MRQQACQRPKVPAPAPLGRVHRERDQATSATGRPPRRAGKSSQEPLLPAQAGLWVPACSWGRRVSRTHRSSPNPAPSQDGPRAARGARRGRPQNSTRRCLGGRAAVAPALRAQLTPARIPLRSRSVCRSSLPHLSLPPLPAGAPRGVPGTASDSSLPAARVSFPRGGGGGAGSISAATALLRLERLSSLAAPRPSPAAPRGTAWSPLLLARLPSGRGAWQAPAGPPPLRIPGLALAGAGYSPGHLPRRP